jgi:phosphoribosylamine--glycine ligase
MQQLPRGCCCFKYSNPDFYMHILIIGSGGREHALAWKISQSTHCSQLFIAPGNPGTAQLGTNVPVGVNDFDALGKLCLREEIALVVVGPEDPLVQGIYDYFQQPDLEHIQVVGPSKAGAQLEGSKAFSKEFMHSMNIPTAAYREFDASNYQEGCNYLQHLPLPVVLKADGLAAGKGVVIAQSTEEALLTFKEMIQDEKFGQAGKKVVVEEFLSGIECSMFVLTNGTQYVLLPEAKDYKRIGEGDTGLNTGGMGAVSPVPFVDDVFKEKVRTRIIEPTLRGLQERKIVYHGFIFIGLIQVNKEPYVIEYNCRLGDPETEVILPRMEDDLVELFLALPSGNLTTNGCRHSEKAAATIMLVSGGYPGNYEKGKSIHGLNETENCLVFHAGTAAAEHDVVTHGGRVLAITALSDNLPGALKHANNQAEKINFEGKYFRRDIGFEFVNKMEL